VLAIVRRESLFLRFTRRHRQRPLADCTRRAVRAVRRRYVGPSLVLETTLQTADGALQLTDWLAWDAYAPMLARRARCIEGRVRLDSELAVRFDYGQTFPWLRRFDDRIAIVSGPCALWFDSTLEPQDAGADATLRAHATLTAGDAADFSLTFCTSYEAPPTCPDLDTALETTLAFWRDWAVPAGEVAYADAIQRSFITLKGLSNSLTGGIVAAATASLPEVIGGARNWDYRYCWLRDASFTLLALASNGYETEAIAWRDWLVRAIAGHPAQTQIMYAVDGSNPVREWECEWLRGYEGSTPVRFGNAAAAQAQHDIYGEVLNALYVARRHGLPPDTDAWALECKLVEHVESVWASADNGLWERRDAREHHTLSKAMTWVAVDRAIRSAREFGHRAPVARWERLAAQIHRDVLDHGFNLAANAFTRSYGSDRLDASLLLLPLFGFLPIDDPRIAGTVEAIERNLLSDGLVIRYRGEPREGAFIACSCWLVQVRQMQGRHDEARELFDRVLALRNDVGLLAEEYDNVLKRQCGNYPQTFSHVALINAARTLDHPRYLDHHR
jgi:GH15 family glucan-1,4-alpha-glucosidase